MDAVPLASPVADHRERWFVLALLLVFVVTSVQYTHKILKSDSASAIQRWKDQILSFDGGDDPYLHYNYPNPPIMALLLRPIVALPSVLGPLVWFYLKVVMTLLAFLWAIRLVESPEQPFPAWAKALAVLFSLRPILGDLMHGNVNLLILFLVIAALYAYRCGRDLVSGLALALAIACKVTPALFVPYFLWKRQWKVLAGTAVGLFLFFWLVPGLCLGFETNERFLHSWTEQMVKPFLVSGQSFYSEYYNQSLPGLVKRLLTHSPSFSIYLNNGADYTPLEYHNVLNLDARLAGWVVRGFVILFALVGVWVCRTPTRPRATWRLAAEFSLVLLGMLLFSERTWKHHCVTLLLPFCVICYYLAVCRPGEWLRSYLIGTLVCVAVLMTATSTTAGFARPGQLAQVYGAYVWSCLLLTAAVAVLLRQPAGNSSEA
jgi:hypothetical protein